MKGKTIEEIEVGDKESFTKTISEKDVNLFAEITGDYNPVHMKETYANKTFFKARIVHGMLSASLISTVIGNKLPGLGTIYTKQEVKFVSPVLIGDTITAQVKVLKIMSDINRVKLETTCSNQNGQTVLIGEALVSPPVKKASEECLSKL